MVKRELMLDKGGNTLVPIGIHLSCRVYFCWEEVDVYHLVAGSAKVQCLRWEAMILLFTAAVCCWLGCWLDSVIVVD